jgi:small ligand-binding sensory domain FIST
MLVSALPSTTMRWASAVSDEPSLDRAVADVGERLRGQLEGAKPDLALVFVGTHHAAVYDQVPDRLAAACAPAVLVGCSAGGVIGGGREVEERPGLSVTAAVLPGVDLHAFHLVSEQLPDPASERPAWERLLAAPAAVRPHFVLLPEPFSFDAERLLAGLDRWYPASQKIGGVASGAREPGGNALFRDRDVHRAGLVGVALSGNVEVDTVVAQGCRPIGVPMFVTRAQGNLLWELDGRQAVEVLRELYARLPRADQDLARHSLFLGIVMSDTQHEYRQGDFLIRNLMGMDPERGVLAVGALLRENTVVQFHLRDAATSAADIEHLLTEYAAQHGAARAAGALLFSCLGRGLHLYGRADHDTDVFRTHLGEVPLGGFFCNGEIGPVHGTTFLHGYTSAFGLFRPRHG